MGELLMTHNYLNGTTVQVSSRRDACGLADAQSN